MTRCANEPEFPAEGFAWTPPAQILPVPLESERLVIRAYELDDIPEVVETIRSNREQLQPWMPWAADEAWSPAHAGKFICEQIIALQDPKAFAAVGLGVFDRATGEFLGGSGVHDVRRDTASCETGYWIRADRRGRGYAGEACARAISWALGPQPAGLGLRRVRAFCSKDNTASVRVLEKLGLRKELHQRLDYHVPHYGVTDRLGFGVLADEWDCQQHTINECG